MLGSTRSARYADAVLLKAGASERARVVRANLADVSAVRRRTDALRKLWRSCSDRGESVFLGETLPGVHGFGVALVGKDNSPFGARSTLGPAEVLPERRASQVLQLLRAKAQAVQERYDMQTTGSRIGS